MKRTRSRPSRFARRANYRLAAAMVPVVLLAGCSTPGTAPSSPSAIWTADAGADGMKAWHGLQSPPGRLRIVNDPAGLYGQVYLAYLKDGDVWSSDGTARAEFYGTDLPADTYLEYSEGDDYYFGWRSMISR